MGRRGTRTPAIDFWEVSTGPINIFGQLGPSLEPDLFLHWITLTLAVDWSSFFLH